MGNPYGRLVVLPLTNKSGGGVVAGDVVIIDTANNDAFTTTTSGAYTGAIGIAQQTIASNAVGLVLIEGYAALVNVNASVTRGHFGKTYTVAKQATDAGTSRVAGTFCMFLTGGTTPDAIMWQPDLGAGTGLTNPMTTTGDTIYSSDNSGTPARLGIGTASQALVGGTTPAWSSVVGLLQSAVATRTAGDLTTTSTTFADLTSMTVTLTTGAHRCLVFFNASCNITGGGANVAYDIAVDGTRQGQAYGLAVAANSVGPNFPVAVTFLTAVLSAASHTIKIQWRVDGGTGTTFASTTVTPAILTVLETGLTT